VTNLFLDEIFINVDKNPCRGFTLQSKSGIHYATSFGFSATVFPDNEDLLKRLHASTRDIEGKASWCGCALTDINVPLPEFALDALRRMKDYPNDTEFIVSLSVNGFFRNSGKPFRGYISLPLIIPEPNKILPKTMTVTPRTSLRTRRASHGRESR
jgi:hypothetical protein